MSAGIPIIVTHDIKPAEEGVIEGHLFIVVDGKRYRVKLHGLDAELADIKGRMTAAEAKLPKV